MMDARLRQRILDQIKHDPRAALLLAARANAGAPRPDPEAVFLVGLAHLGLRAYPAADDAFRHAIALDPANAEHFYYHGLASERMGDRAEAGQAYRAAAALDPRHGPAQKKAREFGRADEPRARPRMNELSLAENDEEWADYEHAVRRKARIDARAKFQAAMTAAPLLYQAVVYAIVVVVIVMGVQFFRDQADQARQDEQHRRDVDRILCERTREQGVEIAGC